MHFLILHDEREGDSGCGLQALVASGSPGAAIAIDALVRAYRGFNGDASPTLVVPAEWPDNGLGNDQPLVRASNSVPLGRECLAGGGTGRGVLLSNGPRATRVDTKWSSELLNSIDADVVCICVDPELASGREKVRVTSRNEIVGFTRLYKNAVWPEECGNQWPHHVYIKADVLAGLLDDEKLPLDFGELLDRCEKASLSLRSLRIGGDVLDLNREEGLLTFLADSIASSGNQADSARGARLFGKVFIGKGVRIGADAMVIGPTILSDNVTIGRNAVIRSSVIGSNIKVPNDCRVENRIVLDPDYDWSKSSQAAGGPSGRGVCVNGGVAKKRDSFRTWPRFSYGGLFKRLMDICFAVAVLLLCAPVLIIIAVAVKLTSRGPVFFAHPRQGLHGREFNCVKFRTMMAGADKLQDLLRARNQVDGPQFKMIADPRITSVGEFLRNTCIDEIPQFFNVLAGHMSVVGPRPSPEKENTLCAYWRDARLSVRPGITGLWQVCRTRKEGQDFQEWVAYDTRYVKNMSYRNDIKICWLTAKQLITGFARQF